MKPSIFFENRSMLKDPEFFFAEKKDDGVSRFLKNCYPRGDMCKMDISGASLSFLEEVKDSRDYDFLRVNLISSSGGPFSYEVVLCYRKRFDYIQYLKNLQSLLLLLLCMSGLDCLLSFFSYKEEDNDLIQEAKLIEKEIPDVQEGGWFHKNEGVICISEQTENGRHLRDIFYPFRPRTGEMKKDFSLLKQKREEREEEVSKILRDHFTTGMKDVLAFIEKQKE